MAATHARGSDAGRIHELNKPRRSGVAPADGRKRIFGHPRIFSRDDVLAVRRTVMARMAAAGLLEPGSNLMNGIVPKGVDMSFSPQFGENTSELDALLFSGRIMDFYRLLFGEEILHFNFTWFRTIAPGFKTSALRRCLHGTRHAHAPLYRLGADW